MLKNTFHGLLIWSMVAVVGALFACNKKEEAPTPASKPAATTASQGQTMAQPQEQTMAETTPQMGGSGESIYKSTCAACHDSGVSEAPKLGDKAAWNSLIAKSREALIETAVKGTGAMPPKGGNPNLSDEEISAAVDYMIQQGQ